MALVSRILLTPAPVAAILLDLKYLLLIMCRSIKVLRGDEPATEEEIEAAARQFVRKVSGMRHPSRANEQVFESAVSEIATISKQLLESLVVRARTP